MVVLLSKLISGILHVLHVLKNHLPGREFELNLPKLGLESFRGVWLQIALCYDSWDFRYPLEVQPPFFIGWFPNHHFL